MWGKLLLALTLYPPGIEFKVWWAGLALTLLLIIDCYFKFLFLTPSLPKSHPHSGEQVVRVVGGGAARGLRAVDSSPPPTLHSGAGLGLTQLSGTVGILLFHLALWLLTVFGSIHWHQWQASVSVYAVCMECVCGVLLRSPPFPQAQELSSELGSVLPPGRGRSSHLPYSLPGLSVAIF